MPADWMGAIGDNTKLNQITMPGAHDAGMVVGHKLFNKGTPAVATEANAGTQGLPIGRGRRKKSVTQLEVGVRWFDVRLKKAKLCGGPGGFRCFHGTAFGESAKSIAEGVIHFLNAHPGEVVILCVTKSTSSGDDTATAKNDSYLDLLLALESESIKANRDTHNAFTAVPEGTTGRQAAALKLGDLRGRVIVAMDKPPYHLAGCNRVVRVLFKKWDAKTPGPFDYKDFDRGQARGKYSFVLNCAGTYSNANAVSKIISGQKKRMGHIKAAMNPIRFPMLSLYYSTNTSQILNANFFKGQGILGMRATSIKTQDKKTWKQKARDKWITDAIQVSHSAGYPVANVVMMDFASENRTSFIRDFAHAFDF